MADDEIIYCKEFLSFLDELRRDRPNTQQPKLLIPVAIDFVSRQAAFKSRLRRTFQS